MSCSVDIQLINLTEFIIDAVKCVFRRMSRLLEMAVLKGERDTVDVNTCMQALRSTGIKSVVSRA